LNYIPLELIDKKAELESSYNEEVIKQADLNEEVNKLTFELAQIQAKIASYQAIQEGLQKSENEERVQTNKTKLTEMVALQQASEEERNQLTVQIQKLRDEV
jgi:mevalonate pyrophosphate decarboxylase